MTEESRLVYSVLQYGADASRLEFLNVGVVLLNKKTGQLWLKTDVNKDRLKSLFGAAPSPSVTELIEDFGDRIRAEFSLQGDSKSLGMISNRLHNSLRLTEPRVYLGASTDEGIELLAQRFLSRVAKPQRATKVSVRLKNAFDSVGVLDKLDRSPEPVLVPGYNAQLRVPFGYKNGRYNLVDAARFDEPERAKEEVGKRLIEAKAIKSTLDYALCIVGDFGEQPRSLSDTVKEDLGDFGADVYRWDEIGLLADKIRKEAH